MDPVNVQDEFEYRIVLTNSGPAVANNVRLTDPVPAGMTPLGYEGTDWSCSLNGQEAQCVYGNPLGVDQSTEILTLRVRADEVGLFTNTCAGESDAADGDGTPGCTEDTTVIGPELRVANRTSHRPWWLVGFRP